MHLFENAISLQKDQNNQVARPCQCDLTNNHIPDTAGSKSSAEKMHLEYQEKNLLKHKFNYIVGFNVTTSGRPTTLIILG